MKKLPKTIKIHNEKPKRDWPVILVDAHPKKGDISAVAWAWDTTIAKEIVNRWNRE